MVATQAFMAQAEPQRHTENPQGKHTLQSIAGRFTKMVGSMALGVNRK